MVWRSLRLLGTSLLAALLVPVGYVNLPRRRLAEPQRGAERGAERKVTPPAPPAPPETLPWLDASKSPEERAELLVSAMNEEQLVHMLHGVSSLVGTRPADGGPASIGYIPAIPQLRVPALVLTDGPSGLRNREPATAFPAPIAQAASFDRSLMEATGAAIAADCRDRGQDVLFGPAFNLARNPLAGRTFEYFGEDPFLSGTMAAANVRGLQENGIMATLKHFVANNQELNRTLSDSIVDQRTLHEIYEKPFQIAIAAARPAAVMCAYNKINGTYACSNRQTQIEDLRERMGFRGFVVSDYPATHAPTDIRDGLSMELPNGVHTNIDNVRRAIAAGQMTWEHVQARVRETLTQMFRFGLFDHAWNPALNDRVRAVREIPGERGYAAALAAAEAGAVLLKNDGILPLAPAALAGKRVLIVGRAAKKALSGGGSSMVKSLIKDSFLTEFTKRMPADTDVDWVSEWNPLGIKKAARRAHLVIVVAGAISTELLDRLTLNFSPRTNLAVNTAARANPNTIVLTQIPGPVLMPWLGRARAVLNVWYPGAAGGRAATNLLLGDVNPSGRLPQTFPASPAQIPAALPRQFPGAKLGFESHYDEGVFMGYRWYQAAAQTPAFPFGFGLSYTTFAYSGARLDAPSGAACDPLRVTFTVANTGARAGAVVPQVYVGKPSDAAIPTPPKELGNYTKIFLEPGQSREVTLEVSPRELSVYDITAAGGRGGFVVRPGTYRVYLADNACDVRAQLNYTVS